MQKLIRDKLYNNPKRTNDYVKRDRKDEKIEVDSDEHWKFLFAKLDEELKELRDSDYKDKFEYADVLEILRAMAFLKNIEWEDIQKAMEQKFQERGSFVDGVIMYIDELPPN